MKAISVIVPCYNVEKYARRCIDSILGQSVGIDNIELILINDASTDGTLGILLCYESLYPENIMVINCEQNGKQGTARNLGMSYASGKYITFVDADDCMDSEALEYMYACAEEYGSDVVDCYYDTFTVEPAKETEIQEFSLYKVSTVETRKNLILYMSNREAPWGKLYRRDFIMDNAIFFPENILYEECYFSQLVAMYANTYCISHTPFYHYFLNENGSTNDRGRLDRLTMNADVQEAFLSAIRERGLVDESFAPYRDEIEYTVLEHIFSYPHSLCIESEKELIDTPMPVLLKRLKKIFPDFIDNRYICRNAEELAGWKQVFQELGDLEYANRVLAKQELREKQEDLKKFELDKAEYISQTGVQEQFRYSEKDENRCLEDYREEAGNIDAHYFFQDIYVAGKVKQSGVTSIYDIGSRVEGYISHLLSMEIRVTMIDIRPFSAYVENLYFVQGNAVGLESIQSDSIPVLSSLHAVEHFGLGRYGDAIDYNGWKKALESYERVIAPGGRLYLSVPVGKRECVEFNAHRIFRPLTIAEAFSEKMTLEEFTYIANGLRTTIDFTRDKNRENVLNVLEDVADKYFGSYDCGIFIFRKEG